MSSPKTMGLEQARNELPRVAEEAHGGQVRILTRRGRPVAAIVPVELALASRRASRALLELRGTGKGLWGRSAAREVDALRAEWDDT